MRQRFVVRPPVAGQAPRKSRSRTVDLRSGRPAGVYESIRHGRDAFIYPHRGSQAFAWTTAHQQNTGFCSASRPTGVRIQQGSECLAEFAFENAFRQQLLKCLAPNRQRGFAMHLEGDRRTCACGYSAGAGRSTCVQTALHGAYETVRHGRDDFIAPHRGSRHWSGSRSSAKHGGFAQQARHAAAPLREQLP